jgi:hypothetical protein
LNKLYPYLAAALSVFLVTSAAYAQTSTLPPAPTEGWRFQVAPYLWGSGFKGTVAIGDRGADVDASFSDILSQLNFGFMGILEATRDRFVTATDLVYINLSDEKATPGPLFSSVEAGSRLFMLAPEAGFRIAGSDTAFVDALGGVRFWNFN